MSKLSHKVAIVTGASKGIGAAIALQLAKDGAAVVVNYASSREGADRVVAQIVEGGGKAIAVQGDVSKVEDLDRLFAETERAFGRLDILVNNAGIYLWGPLETVTPEIFHSQFNINVLGLLLASQRAAQKITEGGSIINIGSAVTVLNMPGGSVYTATKAAVDAITRTLAKELGGRKIRVNSLNPGMVETEGAHSAGFIGSDFQLEAEKATPLGRIGQPDDIAKVASFLASDEAGWLTGQVIFAAGGHA